MNRKEREEHPEESFDGGYHLYAKQLHKDRVAKNPERIEYAIQQFEAHGIKYALKNSQTGHFHCWRKSDGQLFQFYAGTGKIMARNVRGIHALIRLLEEPKAAGTTTPYKINFHGCALVEAGSEEEAKRLFHTKELEFESCVIDDCEPIAEEKK